MPHRGAGATVFWMRLVCADALSELDGVAADRAAAADDEQALPAPRSASSKWDCQAVSPSRWPTRRRVGEDLCRREDVLGAVPSGTIGKSG